MGHDGGTIISDDGINWNRGDTLVSADFRTLTNGNGFFLAVGNNEVLAESTNGNHILYKSIDGKKWSKEIDPFYTVGWPEVIYGNNRFIAKIKSTDSIMIAVVEKETSLSQKASHVKTRKMEISVRKGVVQVKSPAELSYCSARFGCYDISGPPCAVNRNIHFRDKCRNTGQSSQTRKIFSTHGK